MIDIANEKSLALDEAVTLLVKKEKSMTSPTNWKVHDVIYFQDSGSARGSSTTFTLEI